MEPDILTKALNVLEPVDLLDDFEDLGPIQVADGDLEGCDPDPFLFTDNDHAVTEQTNEAEQTIETHNLVAATDSSGSHQPQATSHQVIESAVEASRKLTDEEVMAYSSHDFKELTASLPKDVVDELRHKRTRARNRKYYLKNRELCEGNSEIREENEDLKKKLAESEARCQQLEEELASYKRKRERKVCLFLKKKRLL